MNAQVALLLISLWLGYVLAQGEVVHLETGRPYRANFTYKIHDILTVPYAGAANSFKSEVFATETNKDVKWYFEVELYPKVKVYLYLSSLPSNVARISGDCEFGIVGVNGQKLSYFTRNASIAVGDSFGGMDFDRYFIEIISPFFKNGHLTAFFDIDAFLVYNLKVTDGVMPTEVIGRTATTNPLKCRQQLVRDTFFWINLINGTFRPDIELKTSYKGYKTLQCHSVILTSHMPLFKFYHSDSTHYDFSNELNPEELEDLVSFIYWGTMNHWRRSCLTLYGVASKYGVKCLQEACLDAMVGQLKNFNA